MADKLRSFQPFETNMIVADDRRIIALSDIHADINALIICLRDCAMVIKKKPGFNYVQTEEDADLQTLLKMDIHDENYHFDLNYMWCDYNDMIANTIVVIIGDMIDGVRRHNDITLTCKSSNILDAHEILYYPQVEIKILQFINALNRSSLEKCPEDQEYGRIIKLLGNHEIGNIMEDNTMWLEQFMFTADMNKPDYIRLEDIEDKDLVASNIMTDLFE